MSQLTGEAVPYRIQKPRVRTAEEAQAICERIWIDDQPGSINRGLLRGMVDGQPPYDRGEIARNGQLMRCNINWLTARSALNNARALYVDLINSVPVMIDVEFGGDIDPTDAHEWATIIAEEYTRTLRNWGQYQFQVDQLVDQFVGYGVSFGSNEGIRDWRWIALGLGDVLFPRSTKADEEKVEIVMMRRAYFPFELMQEVTDEETAAMRGWNVEAVKDAVLNKAQGNDPRLGNDFQTLEREMFEATYYYSYASKIDMVWADHLFTRESDGSYTHQIVLTEKVSEKGERNAGGQGGQFLFEKISEYESAEDFFTIFPNGGGNGDIHGQRGLLFDIFPQTQAINQIQCEFVDNMRLSMSMLLQAKSEEALQDLGMIDLGPFKVLPPGIMLMDQKLNPPNADAVAALTYLSTQQASNTGQYSPLASTNAIQDAPTAQQGRMVSANDNILSQSQANTFYVKWTHLNRRTYKRLSMPDWHASEPGGKQALEFQKRCYARGIPLPTEELNVLASPIDIQAVRAVGYGSPANRMSVQAQLMQFAGQMSPESQNELNRSIVSSLTNGRMADILFPRMGTKPSQVQDQHVADLENALLRLGQQVPVAGNNLIHATSHTAAIVQMMQEALTGQVQPQAIISFLQPAIQHNQEHIQLLAKDNINQKKAENFAPIMVQANALLQRAMSIQQRNAAQAQQLGQENEQVQEQLSPVDAAKIANIQSQIKDRDMKAQLAQVKTQVDAQAKVQAGAHKDAALAHKITVDSSANNLHNNP